MNHEVVVLVAVAVCIANTAVVFLNMAVVRKQLNRHINAPITVATLPVVGELPSVCQCHHGLAFHNGSNCRFVIEGVPVGYDVCGDPNAFENQECACVRYVPQGSTTAAEPFASEAGANPYQDAPADPPSLEK